MAGWRAVALGVGLVVALGLTGCRSERPERAVPAEPLAAARDQNPEASPEETAKLAEGNALFGLRLAAELAKGNEDNLCISPYSLGVTLGMVCLGARGETREQIRTVCGFGLPDDRLGPALNRLDLDLRANTARATLRPANSLWLGEGCTPLADYRAAIERDFGGSIHQTTYPKPGQAEVNRWVSERTGGHIPELLPRGATDRNTQLVLANALYLLAPWETEFNLALTRPGPFHTPRRTVTAQMMHRNDHMEYAEGTVGGVPCQVLHLPCRQTTVEMAILLPQEGAIPLASGAWEDAVALAGAPTETCFVEVALPRWELEASARLKPVLSAMGMPLAFDAADLSGMTGSGGLWVDDVHHATWLKVNERGIEASAGTAGPVPASKCKASFLADHPFLYLIRDTKTGLVLFLGRVTNPKG